MTTHITTVQIGNETYKIDAKKFGEANTRAQKLLNDIHELTLDLKEVGQAVEKETGMKGSNAIKYFKTRFNDKLKDVSQTSQVFEKLTEVLDG